MTEDKSSLLRLSRIAVLSAFGLLSVLPASAFVVGASTDNVRYIYLTELRKPAIFPSLNTLFSSPRRFAGGLEAAIADRFPFRRPLIEGYGAVKFFAFSDTLDPRVTRGRDNWLFWITPHYIADARDVEDVELESFVTLLRERSLWSARIGSHYVFLIGSEKATIYPEELPASVRLLHPTIAERLVPMLRRAGVDVVDPRRFIVQAKKAGDVYHRGDSHWNGRGGYAAYLAIVDDLRLTRPVSDSQVHVSAADVEGDLRRLLGISRILPDHEIFETPLHPRARLVSAWIPYDARFRRVDDPRLPTAILFGDSFTLYTEPFLVESFRRSITVIRPGKSLFDKGLILRDRPRFVIQEATEASLRTIADSVPEATCFAGNAREASPRLSSENNVVQLAGGGTQGSLDSVNARVLAGRDRDRVSARELITISGWFVDAPHRLRARAVYLRIDGTGPFRADTCLDRPDVAVAYGVKAYRRSGFVVRLHLRTGIHRIAFDVLSNDGKSRYQAVRSLTIDAE